METGGGNPSRGRFPPLARILIISTHGSEDPTRAGLAFFLAKGAVEAGHKPENVVGGDAAALSGKTVTESVVPLRLPPLQEVVAFALGHKGSRPTYGACGP